VNNLEAVTQLGTSIWLDDLSQARLIDPTAANSLTKLINEFQVSGVTTNPSIFAAALSNSDLYAKAFAELKANGSTVENAITEVTTNDVRSACDLLLPVYEISGGRDGRVSIEVDPRSAHKTEETLLEARQLWQKVDRQNLFIKVPATLEGLPAIRTLTSEGISINATLIFSIDRYEAVLESFIAGLEDRARQGLPLSGIESVASLFVSRVDSEIDRRLDLLDTSEAKAVRGKVAIANACLVYESFQRVSALPRWQQLVQLGAMPQRPLWASTGVKDKSYDDTRYVVDLVAPQTVNTMPEATLLAVADHGVSKGDTISGSFEISHQVLDALAGLGISYDEVMDFLEVDGVTKFEAAWIGLLAGVAKLLK